MPPILAAKVAAPVIALTARPPAPIILDLTIWANLALSVSRPKTSEGLVVDTDFPFLSFSTFS